LTRDRYTSNDEALKPAILQGIGKFYRAVIQGNRFQTFATNPKYGQQLMMDILMYIAENNSSIY